MFFDFVEEGDIRTALDILSVARVSQDPTSTEANSVAARSSGETKGLRSTMFSIFSRLSGR